MNLKKPLLVLNKHGKILYGLNEIWKNRMKSSSKLEQSMRLKQGPYRVLNKSRTVLYESRNLEES